MLNLYIYGLGLTGIIVGMQMIYMLLHSKNRKYQIWKPMACMYAATTVVAVSLIVVFLTRNPLVANVGYAIYYASVDFILIFFLSYTRQYTGYTGRSATWSYLLYAVALLDAVGLLSNSYTNMYFGLEKHVLENNDFVYFTNLNRFFNVHLAFCYILVAAVIIILIAKIINTSGNGFIRYAIILVGFVAIIATNAVFLFFNILEFDVSLYLYGILSVFVGYFTFKYNPRLYVDYMLAAVTEQLECGLLCFDEESRVIYTNQLANNIFEGEDIEQNIQKWLTEWCNGRSIKDIRNGTWTDIYELDEEERHFDVRFVKILGEKKEYRGCYFSFYDISKDVKALEKEKYRATHDPLTGALNRDAFYEEAQKIIDYNEDTDFLVVCSNIKNFKLINEVFGTEAGDEILIRLAGMIGDAQTRKSVYARLEADRFALIMPKEAYKEETFLEAMNRLENFARDTTYKMQVHMGVCELTDRSVEVAILCDRAYLAIDSIKDNYNAKIAYYGEKLRSEYMDEQRIIAEFDGAIKMNQFVLFLQPQVNHEGKIKGAEVLVRWKHPQKGLLAPGRFMDVLERTGFVAKLDHYIWEEACRLLVKWREMGVFDQKISINISPTDFYYMDVYRSITSLVEKYDINPKLLNLEITEAAFMTDKEVRLSLIKSLREYGFIIEMDDFGSGYSSLNMLKDMSVDVLKIDMAFLSHSDDEEKSRMIIVAIINLASNLSMDVITEGVETEEQLHFLSEAQCDTFQGYYFDKPMAISDFEDKYLDIK